MMPAHGPDERVPVTEAHAKLQRAIALTGDIDLGLKAGAEFRRHEAGAFDCAVRSAATIRESLRVAVRYFRLLSDAVEVRIDGRGDRVTVRFEGSVELPRAISDFQVAAFYRGHPQCWVSDVPVEVFFKHRAPENTLEYERTFRNAIVHFDAPFEGFTFGRDCLRERMVTADREVHEIVTAHLEAVLSALPNPRRLEQDVVAVVARELATGSPSIERVARALHVSARTLERKLRREGTTFTALLDNFRRNLALDFVSAPTFDARHVARSLGFTQRGAFSRAFKRWTGRTPERYRRAVLNVNEPAERGDVAFA